MYVRTHVCMHLDTLFDSGEEKNKDVHGRAAKLPWVCNAARTEENCELNR